MATSKVTYIRVTKENTHLLGYTTTIPDPDAGRRNFFTVVNLSHPHTDGCALCAALSAKSAVSVASVVDNIIPRRYRSLVKAILFPVFLLLCEEMLQWAWSIILSFGRSRGAFGRDFAAHTALRETQAEMLFLHWILFTLLAIVYLRAW